MNNRVPRRLLDVSRLSTLSFRSMQRGIFGVDVNSVVAKQFNGLHRLLQQYGFAILSVPAEDTCTIEDDLGVSVDIARPMTA